VATSELNSRVATCGGGLVWLCCGASSHHKIVEIRRVKGSNAIISNMQIHRVVFAFVLFSSRPTSVALGRNDDTRGTVSRSVTKDVNNLRLVPQQREARTWFIDNQPKPMLPPMANGAPQRVVGGEPPADGAYPAYGIPAHIHGLCGGTLIWEDIMVSAAHCYGAFTGSDIYLGTNQLDGTGALDTKVGVQEYYHPDFNLFTHENDIMLIKLDSASKVTPKSWNANNTLPADGDPVTVIGFGLMDDFSDILLQVELSIVDSDTCVSSYDFLVPDVMVCAADGDKGPCDGDSYVHH